MTILNHLKVKHTTTRHLAPLAIIDGLPGGDAELTPEQLRHLAEALICIAADSENLHETTARRITVRREYPLAAPKASATDQFGFMTDSPLIGSAVRRQSRQQSPSSPEPMLQNAHAGHEPLQIFVSDDKTAGHSGSHESRGRQ